ncbi:uncharacterized protein EV420DRAFT_1748418 [Desarmillaria tabescens]|uniref:HAT C-terminal dimerisation domain-containing protein n=1 Tax=Armillaria tabescens TaxID=1929756 RepID=A0AA39KF43_ARMTA|nr:uncharacterized protein EV420DRAFT_1748418 [Desarmillaria tabescens]KAK0457633.1 hypothetical protein EV420DRAFT_1748418 [Desarmillaria tabescens]
MDNAANNGTFTIFLEQDLLHCGFRFCAVEKRIRCFAHIVNLAAKAVTSAITALNAVLLEESMDITQDPIAAVRALEIEVFLDKRDFADLRRYQLSEEEWKALDIIHQILANMKETFPPAASALDDGLIKLETYIERLDIVPAYILATTEEDEARQLFLHKLREYQSLTSIPSTPAQSQISDPHGSHWADDLLGDNLFDITMHPQSLEAEVDAYLSDVKTSHNIVKYWQHPAPMKLPLESSKVSMQLKTSSKSDCGLRWSKSETMTMVVIGSEKSSVSNIKGRVKIVDDGISDKEVRDFMIHGLESGSSIKNGADVDVDRLGGIMDSTKEDLASSGSLGLEILPLMIRAACRNCIIWILPADMFSSLLTRFFLFRRSHRSNTGGRMKEHIDAENCDEDGQPAVPTNSCRCCKKDKKNGKKNKRSAGMNNINSNPDDGDFSIESESEDMKYRLWHERAAIGKTLNDCKISVPTPKGFQIMFYGMVYGNFHYQLGPGPYGHIPYTLMASQSLRTEEIREETPDKTMIEAGI